MSKLRPARAPRILFLNRLRPLLRLPLKGLLFLVALFLVCFPYPDQFVRHAARWRSPQALVEPDNPGLEPLVEELRPRLENVTDPHQVLGVVERFVYEKVPYDWDWNTWGAADYIPTVTEILAKGREDCDGRAVLAASLLARLGYDAQIVTDFTHVWVKTPQGETMGPGKRKAVVATPEGIKLQPGALAQLGRSIGYGIGVFPLLRELILVAVLWYLLLHGQSRRWIHTVALVLLVGGLLAIRAGGVDYRNLNFGMQAVGAFLIAAGILTQCIRVGRRQRQSGEPTAGSVRRNGKAGRGAGAGT
ncbi:MAG: transglutaminase domain-containing protein [Phycisphaerae bacterium]|nr:transglutaminase domain-containing protein [Phycisphaerae bacterium]